MAEDEPTGNRPYFKDRFIQEVDRLEKNEIVRLVKKQKQKRYNQEISGKYSNFYSYAVEYSYNTNIHGIKYLIERRTKCEKIFWSITISISLLICVIMIGLAIAQLNQSSIIVSYNYFQSYTNEIPFPAITICPQLVTIPKYQQVFAHLMCEIKPPKHLNTTIQNINIQEVFNREVDDVFVKCQLFGVFQNCSEIFKPILTSLGVCFSFNLNFQGNRKNPLKVLRAGRSNGLNVILKSQKIINRILHCDRFFSHFKVIIDPSDDYPKPNRNYYLLPTNSNLAVSVKPNLLQTEPYVEKLVILKKQCYQADDLSLIFFKFYTRENCYLECFMLFLHRKCGCIPFYYPKTKKYKSCDLNKWSCIKAAKEKFKTTIVTHQIETSESYCNCKPLCTNLDYDIESVETSWNWQNLSLEVDTKKFDLSLLNVYLKSHTFHAKRKYSWFGVPDIVTTIGGQLSFFMGMSILSIFELIYFFSLRICCNKINHGKWMHYEKRKTLI